MKMNLLKSWAIAGAAAFALSGCVVGDKSEGGEGAVTQQPAAGAAAPAPAPAAQAPMPAPQPTPSAEMRLEVDVAARKVHVYRNNQIEKSYGVAVGRKEWPTQNGEWNVTQVVWNPGWTPPPDESWSKEEEPKDPGDPDNPLGTVQMVYDAPRTIHGTNQPESIGKAASHGSIRMRNREAEELARMLMEAGGAQKDPSFFQQVRENRKQRQEVPLPTPIPIRVINGADNADAVEGERDGGAAKGDSASRGSGRGSARSDSAKGGRS
jgi:lipoprotein-anchoring transpeptidase ErfK/SrfK